MLTGTARPLDTWCFFLEDNMEKMTGDSVSVTKVTAKGVVFIEKLVAKNGK